MASGHRLCFVVLNFAGSERGQSRPYCRTILYHRRGNYFAVFMNKYILISFSSRLLESTDLSPADARGVVQLDITVAVVDKDYSNESLGLYMRRLSLPLLPSLKDNIGARSAHQLKIFFLTSVW